MTKAEIVSEVAKTTGIEKTQVLAVIEEFTTVVKGSLIAGEPVYMRGFGSFIIKPSFSCSSSPQPRSAP